MLTATEKVLQNIETVQGNLDGRLAPLEEKMASMDGIEEKLSRLDGLINTVEDLKVLLRTGDIAGRGDYEGSFTYAEQAKAFALFTVASCSDKGGWAQSRLADMGAQFKAMAEGVLSSGGALVPTEYIPILIKLVKKYGIFRRNCRVVPMASDQQTWPKLAGDVTVYVPGEAGSITLSDLSFENVNLVTKKFATLTAISSELAEDALPEIGEILADSIARGFAKAEDQVGFLGDGTSTYWGFTGIVGALRAVDATIGNIASLTVVSGNAYSEILLTDFDGVIKSFPDYADIEGEVSWYMSRSFFWEVVVPLIEAHSSNIPTIGSPLDVQRGPAKMLRGYPVQFSNVMPTTAANSQICAILGNLKLGSFLGDRRQMQIDQSKDVYFTTDQVGIRGTERVACNVFGVGDTSDAGPICGLIMAAN